MPLLNRRRVRNLAVALALLGLAAWIVPSYFSAERYRHRLAAGLEQSLHRPVKFGSVSFRLLPRPGFTIQDVEVGEDPEFGSEPFARVDQIDCDLRWHSLWRTRIDFARLHLDHPSFNIVLNSRGEWNVEKLLLQSGVTMPGVAAPGSKHLAAPQQLDLDVTDARIDFQVGSDKKPFALTDVRARLQITPPERRVQFQIVASPVRSDLALPTPGPVEISGTWTPGADLEGPIDAHLRTRGALLYDWLPVIFGSNPQIYGVMDTDVQLTGSLPELIVEGETDLTQLQRWEAPSSSDQVPWTIHYRGRLMRRHERIELDNLDASFADSHLHVSGSVDNLISAPQLDCVVALERSRLEDALAAIRRFWPGSGTWNARGRVDAMLSVRGPWKDRQYGGYIGIQQANLDTSSGSFPVSDIAVRIDRQGAVLSPAQISLGPRTVLSAQGSLSRSKSGPQYDVQLSGKGVSLREAAALGGGLGIHALATIGASGSVTGNLRLTGSAWPLERPLMTAHADLRSARFLIPGLTEPLNVPRASVQVTGDQIVADPVVAVLGTSVFNARLAHGSGQDVPWKFEIHANNLNLEQGALWFEGLSKRPSAPLIDRIAGLSSFAARREAASHLFDSLKAEGQFVTPEIHYRGVTLRDFQGNFSLGGRRIELTRATFRAVGGHFDTSGAADFTTSSPNLSARLAAYGNIESPLSPTAIHALMGAKGRFETHGLGHEELADNLTGQIQLTARDISFGDFDPLGTLAQAMHWGKLEPVRGPVAASPANLNIEIRDRSFILNSGVIDLGGASLALNGTYTWSGMLDLNVNTDVRHLRRRWLLRESIPVASGVFPVVRIGGQIGHLVVNPPEVVENAGRARGVR